MSAKLLELPLGAPLPSVGVVDRIVVHAAGLVEITGWTMPGAALAADAFQVRADGVSLAPERLAHLRRDDVAAALKIDDAYRGFRWSGWVDAWRTPRLDVLEVTFGGTPLGRWETRLALEPPAFPTLRHEDIPMGKKHIFSVGRPNHGVSDDLWQLARRLPAPVLDYGCGAGALLRKLAASGADATGLELDETHGGPAPLPEAAARIRRYDGGERAPVADGEFASAVCSEVLEHTREPEAVVRELARVSRGPVLITVPDVGVLPVTLAHWVAPRHVMERTHWWSFTPRSLSVLLERHFARVQLFRLGAIPLNGAIVHESIAAWCEGRAGVNSAESPRVP